MRENNCLWEAVHSFLNFYVDKSIRGGFVGEVVQVDKLFREVLDLHAHVLQACHWCHEVEIFEVNGAVACPLGRDDTVEVELYRDHVNGGRSTVSGDVESVTTNGESRAIGVILFGAIVCTDASICDVLELVEWDVVACDKHNGVGAFADAGNALGQAAKFRSV